MSKLVPHILESVIKNKLGLRQYPYFVTFLITWRCNARCDFCDIWKTKTDFSDELTLAEIKNIFKQLKGIDVLRITGGEPFLRSDLAEVINFIDQNNQPYIIHLTTNGILTDRIVSTLKNINSLEKIHIKISIDSLAEKHDKHRGVPGAFDRIVKTIEELVELRASKNFHIGINHSILGIEEIDTYFELKKIFQKFDISIYAGPAWESSIFGIYGEQKISEPELKPFKPLSGEDFKKIMDILVKDRKPFKDLSEKIIDQYNLRGQYNRLIKNKNSPNPKCVALNNHLRILPNGDVPVCILNGTIVGNLKKQSFKDVWFGKELEKQREWVKECPGCWHTCETDVSAIYTGDIWRGLFY